MKIPHKCPSCGKKLAVTSMKCGECGAAIEGSFDVCPVCQFDPEIQALFDLFMSSRGNVKDVQRRMNLSYPTVRSKMEEMFQKYEERKPPLKSRLEILRMLRNRTITAAEAEEMLKG